MTQISVSRHFIRPSLPSLPSFTSHNSPIESANEYIVSLEKPEYYGYFAFISYSEVKSSTHNRKVLRKGVQKLVFFKHYFSEVPYVSSKKK